MRSYVGSTFVKISESMGEFYKDTTTTKLQVIFPLLNSEDCIWIGPALDYLGRKRFLKIYD